MKKKVATNVCQTLKYLTPSQSHSMVNDEIRAEFGRKNLFPCFSDRMFTDYVNLLTISCPFNTSSAFLLVFCFCFCADPILQGGLPELGTFGIF